MALSSPRDFVLKPQTEGGGKLHVRLKCSRYNWALMGQNLSSGFPKKVRF